MRDPKPAKAGGAERNKTMDLVERLEEVGASQQHIDTDFARSTLATGTIREAAARIRALEEGLRPFANICLGRESFGDEAEIEIARPNVGEYAVGQNVSRARLLMKEFRQAARLLHDEGEG